MARFSPDQAGDAVADAGGLGHPSGLVPAGDEHFAPLVAHDLFHCGGGGRGQRAKGVAVKVNDSFGQVEHGFGCGEIGHGGPPVGQVIPTRFSRSEFFAHQQFL